MNDVTFGNVIGVGSAPAGRTGNLFVDGSEGPMLLYIDEFTIEGNVTLKAEGATDTLPPVPPPQGTSLGTIDYEPLLASAFYVGYNPPGSVGRDHLTPENYVGGSTLLWTSLGVDAFFIEDTEFTGDVTVLTGDAAAVFGAMGCIFDGSLAYVKGVGGAMEPTDGIDGAPLGAPMTLASVFQLNLSEVAGSVLVYNASGNALVGVLGTSIVGDFLSVNGPGAISTRITSSDIDGNVTLVNAGSTDVVNLTTPVSTYATSTIIGSAPGDAGALQGGYSTTIGGNLVILNGIGNDQVTLTASSVGGMFLLSDGPDGSYTRIIDSSISGPSLFLRGDGGDLVKGLGITTGNAIGVTDSYLGVWTLVVNGGGDDLFSSDTDTTFGGDVSIYNGPGDQYLDLFGSFGGNVAVIDPAADRSEISVGNGISPVTGIAGNLTLWTGSGDDAVTFLGAQITGATDVRTGFGNDTLAVDDSVFNGAASFDTGVGAMGALTDADTVNIEQVATGTTATVFASALNIATGDDADTVNIGVHHTEGVGDAANGAYAVFDADITMDGGSGTDTLNYLTAGNQFENDSVLNAVNVETIV